MNSIPWGLNKSNDQRLFINPKLFYQFAPEPLIVFSLKNELNLTFFNATLYDHRNTSGDIAKRSEKTWTLNFFCDILKLLSKHFPLDNTFPPNLLKKCSFLDFHEITNY